MNRLDCLIAGVLLLAPCSCQQEALSGAGEPKAEPVMAIDEALQQYGEELMQNKEGALLAVDPTNGSLLAGVFNMDRADSLRVIGFAEECLSAIVRNDDPEEVEGMWLDVNRAPGTGARLWIAHVDGLDICGRGESIDATHPNERPVFIGFAPRESPRVMILSFVKGSPYTATYSAPIGSLMIERYLLGETTRPHLERRMMGARPGSRRRVVCGTYYRRLQETHCIVNGE